MTVFVDTNVLVYARDVGQGRKHERAREWMQRLWANGTGRLSVQVLNEYFVTVTRMLASPLPPDEARADVRDLVAWQPIALDVDLLESAWAGSSRWRLSHWDALIVAAAQRAHCASLLTEDLQPGQDFAGVRVVSPFTTSYDALA
ncbi:MAG: PIN domain-containing protein [Candidatus Dormiibacterota bacterium]